MAAEDQIRAHGAAEDALREKMTRTEREHHRGYSEYGEGIYFTIVSCERTATHFPSRLTNTSIQAYFPLESFPS